MVKTVYRMLNLNPEPWAMGNINVQRGRGGGSFPKVSPNLQLEAFQNAVREEIQGDDPLPFEEVELEFYFWRRLDRYTTLKGRKVAKSSADATNLQKGLEDALQKHLFANDRQVKKVTSELVEQDYDTNPMILIVAREYIPIGMPDVPQEVQNQIRAIWNRPGDLIQPTISEDIF